MTRRQFLGATAAAGLGSVTIASGASAATLSSPLVGARVGDITWARANSEIGPLRVTRLYYPGALPARFTRSGIPEGVRLIVSYKNRSASTGSYVRSIPASARVEVCYHHEPEGTHDDYWGDKTVAGPRFVSEFRAEQATISAANPAIPVVFIGGGYQYSGGAQNSRGIGGHFIPPTADFHYMDTYQTDTIIPASQTPSVRNFIAEVGRKGGRLNGFSEYARGVAPLSSATIQARIKVFATDSAWLRSRPGIRAWCYWNTTDQDGRQWRLMDAASQDAWSRVARQ
jgi:hypothetical protein